MATISPSAAALSTGEGVVVGVHDVSVDPDGGVREKLLYHMVFIRRQSTIWHQSLNPTPLQRVGRQKLPTGWRVVTKVPTSWRVVVVSN